MKRLIMIAAIINGISFYAPAVCFDGFELDHAEQIYGKNNQIAIPEKKEDLKKPIDSEKSVMPSQKEEASQEQMNKNSPSSAGKDDFNLRIFNEMQTN